MRLDKLSSENVVKRRTQKVVRLDSYLKTGNERDERTLENNFTKKPAVRRQRKQHGGCKGKNKCQRAKSLMNRNRAQVLRSYASTSRDLTRSFLLLFLTTIAES